MDETTKIATTNHRHEKDESTREGEHESRKEGNDYDRSGMRRRHFLTVPAAFVPAAFSLAATENERVGESAGNINDVSGLRVGHFTDTRRPTGCTVVLFDQPAIAGVDVRGAAPGTRETDLLQPVNTVQRVNAILLSGGSAFGLDAASGVMRYLDEKGVGFHVGSAVVPIVPAAILFDLNLGDSKIRPDAHSGYLACQAAASGLIVEGSVGAGAGATVGKLFGAKSAMKSGLGTASMRIGESGLIVAALVAVNAIGDVFDHRTGQILAGARRTDSSGFLCSMEQISRGALIQAVPGAHTTIGLVATNATLTKTEATKVAQMAHDGLARTINPVHTPSDGDTIFAAATCSQPMKADLTTIGSVAAEAMARAVSRAVLTATGIPGYPSHHDLAATFNRK